MVWKGGGDERLAKSLITLIDQVDARWPVRDRSSDGTIGDARHQATKSEHNPDQNGVVRALDISNDPAHGVVSRTIAQSLLDSRDSRVLYVISNRQIARSYPKTGTAPWQWSAYTGENPHDHHCHVSVVDKPALYDDTRPWQIEGAAKPVSAPAPAPSPGRFHSLVPGGFFSSPDQASKFKPSIWSNNPGAINGADKSGHKVSWVQSFPGFVKTVVIGGGNPIAVFETPEQGLALWWTLLQRYRDPSIWTPVSTVQGIVNRYGGGQDYSEYVKYVCDRTGFAPAKVINLNDDAALIRFARAMFRYEAGVETPLSDAQIVLGFQIGRNKGVAPIALGTQTKPKAAPSVSAKVGIGGALVAGMTLGAHWLFEHWLLTGLAFVIAVAWLAIYFVHREEHP